MERRHYTFRGSVQGVGFRVTAASLARGLPVSGWVRNEPDGSVAMEIQGEPAEIELLLIDLRERMSGRITDESHAPSVPVEGESSFEIRH